MNGIRGLAQMERGHSDALTSLLSDQSIPPDQLGPRIEQLRQQQTSQIDEFNSRFANSSPEIQKRMLERSESYQTRLGNKYTVDASHAAAGAIEHSYRETFGNIAGSLNEHLTSQDLDAGISLLKDKQTAILSNPQLNLADRERLQKEFDNDLGSLTHFGMRRLIDRDPSQLDPLLQKYGQYIGPAHNGDLVSHAQTLQNKADNEAAQAWVQNRVNQWSGGPQIQTPQRGTGDSSSLKSAIYGQEGSGPNSVSVNGARGKAQIIEGTFNEYARPGESYANEADRVAVSGRLIDDLSQKYNGDPARVAVAYFSGPGNVAPPGSPTPYKQDLKDGNGVSTSSYVKGILGRVGATGATSTTPSTPPASNVPAITPKEHDDFSNYRAGGGQLPIEPWVAQQRGTTGPSTSPSPQAPAGAGGEPAKGNLAPFPSLENELKDLYADPSLTPKQRSIAEKELRGAHSEIMRQSEEERRQIGLEVQGGVEKLRQGQTYNFDENYLRHWLQPKDADKLIAGLNDAKNIGQKIHDIQDIPIRDATERLNNLEASLPNTNAADYAVHKQNVDAYRKAMNIHVHNLLGWQLDQNGDIKVGAKPEPVTNPAAYLINSDQRLKNAWDNAQSGDPNGRGQYVNAVLAKQDKLGVPTEMQHVLPADYARAMAHDIMSDPAHAAAKISGLDTQWGKEGAQKVMGDLVQLGGLSTTYQLLGSMPNPQDRDLLSRGILIQQQSGKDHISFWKDMVGTQDFDLAIKDIRADGTYQQFVKSMLDSKSSGTQIDAFQKGMETMTYTRMVLNRETEPEAMRNVINATAGNYKFMPGGGRVPKDIYDKVYHNAGDTIAKLAPDWISAPPGIGGVGQPTKEQYISSVKSNPQWQTDTTTSSIYLKDNQNRFIRDNNGMPVSVRFDEPVRGYMPNYMSTAGQGGPT